MSIPRFDRQGEINGTMRGPTLNGRVDALPLSLTGEIGTKMHDCVCKDYEIWAYLYGNGKDFALKNQVMPD
jgi:hypothetical protein